MENLLSVIQIYTLESLLVSGILGLMIGSFIVYRLQRSKHELLFLHQQEQFKSALEQVESKLSSKNETIEALNKKNEVLQHRENKLTNLSTQFKTQFEAQKQLADEIPEMRVRIMELEKNNTALQSAQEQGQERLKAQQNFIEQAQQQLKDQFNHLGQKILDEKTHKFTEVNKQNIKNLVTPLHDQLKDFSTLVNRSNKENAVQSESLKIELNRINQMNQILSKKAEDLTHALKSESKTQGNWGEMVLKKLLDLAGLEEGREYQTEVSFTESGKQKRPDVLVNLPDGKTLIIDSKVSLTAYERYVNAEDDQIRDTALKGHLQSLNQHISGLSAKNYQQLEGIETVDFVLMFVAIEPAYLTAVNQDTMLLENAYHKNVLLVSASNLLATLRTVSLLWQNDKQNKNARDIASRAGKLIDKFSGFYEDFNKIRGQLDSMERTWETADKKLRTGSGNLYRQMEQLADLGAKNTKKLSSE
ncbi:DNA recombination protein RmuC [Marinicella rhabdoformis]|uniref:DNA recombination protein RmuC n=1 Tax=Marinicella rhabdoformis TaxID=2580566 RepID=UPI0012AED3E4|nr:DNA recombination protein RmuC [Marinicella rhabdoformis]